MTLRIGGGMRLGPDRGGFALGRGARLGAAAAFSPLALGAKLLEWWSADRPDLMALSGTQVASWRGVKGNLDVAQATAASQPTFSASSFNGAPAVIFDGVDDHLRRLDHPFPGVFEAWGVVEQGAAVADTASRRFLSWGGATGDVQFRVGRIVTGGANRVNANVGAVGGAIFPTVTADFSTRHVVRVEVGAGQGRTSLDNTAGAVVSKTTSIEPGALCIGAVPAGTANFWQGRVRDLIVTAPLTASEADMLRAWALPRRMI